MTPVIVVIDDEAATLPLPASCSAVRLNPTDSDFSEKFGPAVKSADLILLDHNLMVQQQISLNAIDGASFVGHLRSWARKQDVVMPPIAIFTSEDQAFAKEIPLVGPAVPLGGTFVGKEARLAPALDVDWLINKDDDDAQSHVEQLALACSRLRVVAGDNKCTLAEIEKFLELPQDVPWAELAREHVARARPPISEGAGFGSDVPRGVSPVLRWLLQRCIAYPGLLLSDLQTAAALGVSVETIAHLAANPGHSAWSKGLADAIYQGPAHGMFARRWWAAGVDYAGWKLRDALETEESTFEKLSGAHDVPNYANQQIVLVDEDLLELELGDIETAVQLHPRGWPSEANEPWASIDLIKREPLLQAMLDPADKEMLFQ